VVTAGTTVPPVECMPATSQHTALCLAAGTSALMHALPQII
jgi:hypothetical protein